MTHSTSLSVYIVIHLGGSIVVPHISDKGGINVPFLKEFRKLIAREIQKGFRFIIVTGGGKTCRVYQRAANKVKKVSNRDLDWLGIHAGRLNSHLLRTIFVREAYPVIIDHNPSQKEVSVLKRAKNNLFFASGWTPGWSHDYVAVGLAKKFGAKQVFIAKDTPFVYNKDPKKYPNARPIKEISWEAYKKIISSKWTPGLSTPVDPIATRLAEKIGVTAKILKGTDLANFQRAIEGKSFEGTVIL